MDSLKLELSFRTALQAILNRASAPIKEFFEEIRDFNGIDRRYGQIAVPDFIEYLANSLCGCSCCEGFDHAAMLNLQLVIDQEF